MIALLTDFGIQDPFVGIMKGVMLRINPALPPVVDLTHEISPQGIGQAAFVLKTSLSFFPEKTLFVVVVDPGVGTNRKILYIETKSFRFLIPDNGVAGMALENARLQKVIQVTNQKYFLSPLSRTFHGRDIFAPVAAHLTRGISPEKLGSALKPEELVSSPFPQAYQDSEGTWHGQIVFIDRFGNLISNLWRKTLNLEENDSVKVRIKGKTVKGFVSSYENRLSEPFAVIGSLDTVEIAMNRRSAAKFLKVKCGEEVMLQCRTCCS